MLMRDQWVRDRFFTTCLINIQAKDKIEPKDLITFDWEQSKKLELPTEEDLQRILERDKKLLRNG